MDLHIDHSSRRLVRGGVVAAILAAAAALAPAASAAPIESQHYSFTESFTIDDCGFLVRDDVVGHGLFMLKEGRAGDPTPYLFDNYDFINTWTNVATGASITVSSNGLYKDLKVTNVEGTVYDFVSIETGQPFVVRDSDGNVLIRDRGNLVRSFTIDTKGDRDLDNDEFVEGSFSWLDHGRHPGFTIDFCAMLNDLIG